MAGGVAACNGTLGLPGAKGGGRPGGAAVVGAGFAGDGVAGAGAAEAVGLVIAEVPGGGGDPGDQAVLAVA